MLGKSLSLGASSSSYNKRIFFFEVEGLRQNEPMQSNSYPIRNSGRVLVRVPYSCMNDEMRRINRLGGKIVSIRSTSGNSSIDESTDESAQS